VTLSDISQSVTAPGREAPSTARRGANLLGRLFRRSEKEAREEDSAGVTALGGPGILSVTGLRKSYGGRTVVSDASLSLRQGEAVGLLGPNGAGKTTIFYMITGLVAADLGTISLEGNDITQLPMYQRARLGIGYLPQEASIFRGLSVEDNIRAVLEVVEPDRRERERQLDQLLEEFTIARLRKAPSIALSGGERRRCEIARALAGKPSFILLDEPFAGIDPIAVGDIQALVRQLTDRGIGVLITDHNVRETLGLVDRAYIIHSGRVLTEGSPAEIIANPDVRRVYLGEDFRL
jgi:lipopolysaccharide export system ATP-binding protein